MSYLDIVIIYFNYLFMTHKAEQQYIQLQAVEFTTESVYNKQKLFT